MSKEEEPDYASCHGGKRGKKVEHYGFRPREPSINEQEKVAYLLRYLVKYYRHSRGYAQRWRRKKARCYHDAVNEIMEPVPYQVQVREGVPVLGGMVVMPVDEFFQHEKAHDTKKREEHDVRRPVIKRLRYQVQERRSQKRARSEAHHRRQHPANQLLACREGHHSNKRYEAYCQYCRKYFNENHINDHARRRQATVPPRLQRPLSKETSAQASDRKCRAI